MTSTAPNPEQTRARIGLEETAALLRERDDFLIVSHQRPDGDCIGSTIGLLFGLEAMGKRVAAYNASRFPEDMKFLPGRERVRNTLPPWPVQTTVFVDCGGVKRVSDDFQPIGVSLNIDHHLTNEAYADFNFIDPDASAVGDQIYQLLMHLGVKLTPVIATGLYLSVMSDTGGFRFSNTTAETFRLAAKLVEAGADPGMVAQEYYESRHPGEFLIVGRALSRLRIEEHGAVAFSWIEKQDYVDAGGEEAEPEGLVNELRAIRGVEISVLLHEGLDGVVRVGFRGKGRINCAAIASACGGGGHFNASGAILRGLSLADGEKKVQGIVRAAVHSWQDSAT